MHNSHYPQPDEVEQLLRNAELRDELERYFDESISRGETCSILRWPPKTTS